MKTTVYTDGACKGNPGPGGWAWVVPDGPSGSGGEAVTTNQRMELRAALEAIRSLEGPLDIVSDSTYLVNCFRDGWWRAWIARGWISSQRKPVANRDLWEPIIEAFQHREITFRWVKGHGNSRWNQVADQMAVEAAARAGSGSPASDDLPAGHRLWVGGLRAEDLGGYEETLTASRVRETLESIIRAKHQMHPDLMIVSGLDLGTETIAAEVALDLGIPLVAVQPFPGIGSRWPAPARERMQRLLDKAATVQVISRITPKATRDYATAMERRDRWLAERVDEALMVWDGRRPTVAAAIDRFRQTLGEENVWVSEIG